MTEMVQALLIVCVTVIFITAIVADLMIKIDQARYGRPINYYHNNDRYEREELKSLEGYEQNSIEEEDKDGQASEHKEI